MTPDNTIVLRVFDYGFQDAKKYKIVSSDRIRLEFPTSRIIYLEHNSKTPDEVILELDFKEQGIFEYKVQTMKFLAYSISELTDSHMSIMLPLYLLKLRKAISSKKPEGNASALKCLISDILTAIAKDEEAGNLTHEDTVILTNLLKLLYDELYSDIKEFKQEGVDSMLTEKLHTYTEEVAIKIARNLLKLNVGIDKIAEATELSIEDVKKLQENHSQL